MRDLTNFFLEINLIVVFKFLWQYQKVSISVPLEAIFFYTYQNNERPSLFSLSLVANGCKSQLLFYICILLRSWTERIIAHNDGYSSVFWDIFIYLNPFFKTLFSSSRRPLKLIIHSSLLQPFHIILRQFRMYLSKRDNFYSVEIWCSRMESIFFILSLSFIR